MAKRYIAGIHVGSHASAMSLAEVTPSKPPHFLERLVRPLNLGADTFTEGTISKARADSLIDVLHDFQRSYAAYPDPEVRVIGTAALREAGNVDAIVARVMRETGLKLEIISTATDDYLQRLGTVAILPDFNEMVNEATLFLSLGTGAIQVTLYDRGRYGYNRTLVLGALRVRELLRRLVETTGNIHRLTQEYIKREWEEFRTYEPRRTRYKHLVVNGSLVGALRASLDLAPKGTVELDREDFSGLIEEWEAISETELARKLAISEDEASLLLPSAYVLQEVFAATELDCCLLTSVTLDKGLVHEAARKLGWRPARDLWADSLRSVRQVARRYRTNKKHAKQVENFSLILFDALQQLHGLDARARLLLQEAAILHNIGKYLSMREDKEFAYEIIQNAEIFGLNDSELDILSALAYSYDGKIDPDDARIRCLSPDDYYLFYHLAAILSVAIALDASHNSKIQSLQPMLKKNRLVLEVKSDEDLTFERWQLKEKEPLFAELYGRKLSLKEAKTFYE